MNLSAFVLKTSLLARISIGMLLAACTDPNLLIVSPGETPSITNRAFADEYDKNWSLAVE